MSSLTKGRTDRLPFPLLQGILPFDRARLPADVIAGTTLAALAIPEVMGYATIAGMPVVTGLYTMLLPILLFALFGSSRHLVVGADSATAAILATGLAGMGLVAGSDQYVQTAAFAALVAGVVLLAARVLRLGFIANFLSSSVLVGFLTGVGIQVAAGQVGDMVGITGESGGTLERLAGTLRRIPTDTDVPTVLVSIGVVASILVLRRVDRRIPGALIAVAGSIVVSALVDLAAHGVRTLGPVPSGLPSVSLPTTVMNADTLWSLLPIVFPIFIVILAQSAATSRAYAMRYSDRFEENVDLVGLSLASFGAGLTGTFVVNGSPTKTQMVDGAGGRSQIAQLTAGAIVIVVLIALTGPLSYLPDAVLASVVFLIGIELIDVRGMRRIYRLRRTEFVVAAVTALTVITVGVMQGIVLAMILSVVEHLSHSYAPRDRLLGITPTGQLSSNAVTSDKQMVPRLAAYHFGAGLYYANVARFSEEILGIAGRAAPPLRWFAIVGSTISDIDITGAEAIRQLHGELAARGVTLVLTDLDDSVRQEVTGYGLDAVLGLEHVFDTLEDAIAAFLASAPPDHPGS